MKIYSDSQQYLPKIFAIILIFSGTLLIATFMKAESITGIFLSTVLFVIGIWTFFAKNEHYIDCKNKMVVANKRWLWFSWGHEIALEKYKYITVTWHGIQTEGTEVPIVFQACLVSQYSNSNNTLGLGGFDNFLINNFKDKESAVMCANHAAQQTGKKVLIGNDV